MDPKLLKGDPKDILLERMHRIVAGNHDLLQQAAVAAPKDTIAICNQVAGVCQKTTTQLQQLIKH